MKKLHAARAGLWRRLAGAWGRLAVRIYLFAIVCLVMTAAAWLVLLPLFIDPKVKDLQLGVASYALGDVAQHRQKPDLIQRQADKVHEILLLKLTIYDSAGRILVTNVEPPLPPPSAAEQHALSTRGSTAMRGPRGIVVITPNDGSRELLYGVVEMPTGHFLSSRLGGLLAAALVVLAILSFVFARRIARPLAHLTHVARDLGRGNLDARTGLDRPDKLGELGELARAFDDMAERIAQLLRAQKALLADVSHELRTPLARLRLALDIAAEDTATGSDIAAEELAHLSGDLAELERLVADLLQVARLELGNDSLSPPIRRELCAAGDLIEATAARFRILHTGHPLSLDIDIADPLPVMDCDPMLLRRAIDNLLDNAAKYSEPGAEVTLRASCTESALAIEVVDRGIGMSAAELEHAFTPFWRADRSRARVTGGVGLGLALARRIARAHGGDITLASAPGRGTSARLLMPLA